MTDRHDPKQGRIHAQLEEIKKNHSDEIHELLTEVNRTRLHGKGAVTQTPIVEGNSLRWRLAWTEKRKISFELSIVVNIEDDGRRAHVGRVWVHRHASTPLDYEGHTPTTRMRRLTGLNVTDIREAIDAEWA